MAKVAKETAKQREARYARENERYRREAAERETRFQESLMACFGAMIGACDNDRQKIVRALAGAYNVPLGAEQKRY